MIVKNIDFQLIINNHKKKVDNLIKKFTIQLIILKQQQRFYQNNNKKQNVNELINNFEKISRQKNLFINSNNYKKFELFQFCLYEFQQY